MKEDSALTFGGPTAAPPVSEALVEAKRLFDLLRTAPFTFIGKGLQDYVYEIASVGELVCLRALYPERAAEWDAHLAALKRKPFEKPRLYLAYERIDAPTDGATVEPGKVRTP